MAVTITPTQALDVARRFNPRGMARIRFRANGTVVPAHTSSVGWAEIEVWECWREDDAVQVQKVPYSGPPIGAFSAPA